MDGTPCLNSPGLAGMEVCSEPDGGGSHPLLIVMVLEGSRVGLDKLIGNFVHAV